MPVPRHSKTGDELLVEYLPDLFGDDATHQCVYREHCRRLLKKSLQLEATETATIAASGSSSSLLSTRIAQTVDRHLSSLPTPMIGVEAIPADNNVGHSNINETRFSHGGSLAPTTIKSSDNHRMANAISDPSSPHPKLPTMSDNRNTADISISDTSVPPLDIRTATSVMTVISISDTSVISDHNVITVGDDDKRPIIISDDSVSEEWSDDESSSSSTSDDGSNLVLEASHGNVTFSTS